VKSKCRRYWAKGRFRPSNLFAFCQRRWRHRLPVCLSEQIEVGLKETGLRTIGIMVDGFQAELIAKKRDFVEMQGE